MGVEYILRIGRCGLAGDSRYGPERGLKLSACPRRAKDVECVRRTARGVAAFPTLGPVSALWFIVYRVEFRKLSPM